MGTIGDAVIPQSVMALPLDTPQNDFDVAPLTKKHGWPARTTASIITNQKGVHSQPKSSQKVQTEVQKAGDLAPEWASQAGRALVPSQMVWEKEIQEKENQSKKQAEEKAKAQRQGKSAMNKPKGKKKRQNLNGLLLSTHPQQT